MVENSAGGADEAEPDAAADDGRGLGPAAEGAPRGGAVGRASRSVDLPWNFLRHISESQTSLITNQQAIARAFLPIANVLDQQRDQLSLLLNRRLALDVPNFAVHCEQITLAAYAQLRDPAKRWSELVTAITRPLVSQLFSTTGISQVAAAFAEISARYLPANWRGHDIDMDDVWRVAKAEGLALVWVPRGEIVAELLAADDTDARWQLLAAKSSDIVEDCSAVVAGVELAELADYRLRLEEALASHRAGFPAAAQSLAAVVFTALVQAVYAHGKLSNLRKSTLRSSDPDEVTLYELKAALLVEASLPAVEAIGDLTPAENWPTRFNRHLTLHRVAGTQYTTGNAIAALMLATALLAEAQSLLNDGLISSLDARAEDGPIGREAAYG